MATKYKRGGGVWEREQSKAAGKRALDTYAKTEKKVSKPIAQDYARNRAAAEEQGMSLSASKYRERGRSKLPRSAILGK